MAKGNNNIRNKKSHSSKPYDVSNSFVKKVTSGVTSLLPQGSWLTRWFVSNSTPVEETQPATNEDHDNEHVSHSPPTKRARIPLNRPFPANSFRVSSPIDRGETHPWPSESVTSPIPNVFSDSPVPGPSGLSRTPVAPGPFQTPSANAEGLEGKINGDGGSDSSESTSGCSSLAPQRATSGGTTVVHHTSGDCKMANHMPSHSLFPSTLHKLSPSVNPSLSRRRPSFNVSSFGSPNLDSSKLSRESSFNSPFYIGRTIFGGASAYRRPREGTSSEKSFFSSTRRGGVTVRPANEKSQSNASAETSMSQTARRILEALEQFSSPVSEARRMPLPPQPPLSVKRKRQFEPMGNLPAQSVAPTAITNPLTIPMPPERLRLHRLQDATEAARRIASSASGSRSQYTLRSSDGDSHQAGTGKVTKSKPLDEDELLLPVNLPNVSLPITTLPSFELFPSQVQHTNTNSRTSTSKIVSKQSAASADGSDEDGDKNKSSRVVSTSSFFVNTSSNVNLSAAPNSGMKPINFVNVKSSAGVSKFKMDAANADASNAECGRKSDISSEPPNMFGNPSKPNPKSVSFSGTFPYVNNPMNPKDQIEISNSSPSTDMHRASAVSTFVVKGAPFSNAYADCDNTLTTNDFSFSTPTVLSTTRLKDNTEMQKDIFDFCKPQVLDCSKYDGKLKRNEPNGFHALHSSSKVDRAHDSPVVVNTAYKEGSEKISVCKDSKSDDKSTGTTKNTASRGKENNGWAAKFKVPNSWECPSCLVRNNNDVKICVCCGSKAPFSSGSVSEDTEKKSAVPSAVLAGPSPGWGTKYALQPGMWECSTCLVRNKVNDSNCVSCTTPKSGTDKPAAQGDWGSQFRLNAGMWECSACLVRNKEQDIKCVSCTTPRSNNTPEENSNAKNIETKPDSDWGQKFKKPNSSWECPVCLIVNKDTSLKCVACQEPKVGMDKNRSSTGGSIKFNFDMPSDASSFKFGIDKAEEKRPDGNSALFSFGGSAKKETGSSPGQANFVFGANASESKLPAGVKFGISSQDKGSINEKSNAKAGESVVTSTCTSTVPASSSTFPQAPQKGSLQTDNTKVGGFTFGFSVSSSADGGTSKKSGININESSQKDFKFNVTQASPTSTNAGETDKSGGTFAVPQSKNEQKTAAETKPTFSFNTSPAATTTASSASVSTTTAAVAATTTAMTSTTVGAAVAAKPDTFSFSANITSASAVVSTTTVTTTAAVAVPVSTSSAPVFSFGSNATSFKPAVSTPGFSFGGSGVQTTSSGIFGVNRTSQFKSPGDGLFSNKAAASSISLFGGSSTTSKSPSVPTFGTTVTVSPTTTSTTVTTTAASVTPTTTSAAGGGGAAVSTAASTTTTNTTTGAKNAIITSTSTFTKPAATSVSTFNTPAVPVFASLNTVTSKAFAPGITKPTFANTTNSFGSDNATSAATTTAAICTAISATTASTTVLTSGTPSTPASSFGLQGTNTTPNFGVPVTASSFSTSISTFGSSTTSSSFVIPTTTTPVAISPSVQTPKFGTPSCVPFGGATTTGNVFGTATASQSFSTASSSVFGAGNTANFGSPSTTPAFGSGPAASNFGNSFGAASTTAPTFGTVSTVTTASSTTNLPVFGAFQSSAKPSQGLFMFGSNLPTTTQSSNYSFNVASQAGGTQGAPSGTTAFSFGSGAVSSATNVTTSTNTTPTAAATPVAAAAAGAPGTGFGAFSFTGNAAAASSPAPPLFGNAAPAAPVFGSSSVPPTAPSGASFGTGSSNNAGVFRPATFNFGSGGTQPPFAFGSSVQPGAAQSTGSSGFAFGQGQPPVQSQTLQFNPNVRPTFNFTGGETPQFTASAQSTTATPQRRMKKAVRRALR